MKLSRFTGVVVLALVCFRTSFAAVSAAELAVPVQGQLPNGLRYFVLPHTSAKRDLSLRLLVHTGSLDERDDERGFAHFIEHMAFNGTRNHPAGSIRNFFQKIGLTFGADLNASTSYTDTSYRLDLPDGRADHLDEALAMLRDYADGLLFPADEVRRESSVVISELNARDSAARRTGTELIEKIYGATLLPRRSVGGVQEQLAQATADKLRAFYDRNYLPDRMTVVVVGAIEPAAVVEKIKETFGSITSRPEAAPVAIIAPPTIDEIKAVIVVAPSIRGIQAEFLHSAQRSADTREGRREELVQRIAASALARRLQATREAGEISRFSAPGVGLGSGPVASLVHHTVAIGTSAKDWAGGVELLESELRRARSGFSQAEVNEAVAAELTTHRNRIASFAAQTSAQVATRITALVTAERSWTSVAEDLEEAKQAFEKLPAEEVTRALQSIFPENGWHIVLRVPPTEQIKPEEVLASHARSAGKSLRKSNADASELTFRYDDFGEPGEVAQRSRVEDLDLTLVTFANGVRLNVRPSKLENERFRLRIVFPQNASSVPADQGGMAELAGQLLIRSDLGRHKETELGRLMRLHGIVPQFSVANGTPIIGVTGPASELSFALRWLTAVISDVKFDSDHHRVALSHYSSIQRSLITNPRANAFAQALYYYTEKDPRVLLTPATTFARLEPAVAETWLRNHLLQGPLEIGIVGDVSVDEAVSLAASSVGTLKPRRAAPKPGEPLKSPTKSSRYEKTAELAASTSLSCALWPVRLPEDPRHNAALALATDILRDRLLLVLREALGATYSPDARVSRDAVQRDFAFASVVNTFDPANAIKLTEGTVRLAARLAEKGASADEFARLLEPLRTRYRNDLRDNGWWLAAVVATAQTQPSRLDDARVRGKICDELTLDDVNEAARVFTSENVTVVILRPASAAKPPPNATPAAKE
jgi:zinc protease